MLNQVYGAERNMSQSGGILICVRKVGSVDSDLETEQVSSPFQDTAAEFRQQIKGFSRKPKDSSI